MFAAALLLQLVLVLDDRDDPFRRTPISDARSYAEWAERIARHGLSAEPTFYQAPLFPVLLAGVRTAAGPSAAAWLVLQALLSSSALALLVPVGKLAFGSVPSGVAAAAVAALHGAIPFHALKLLPPPLAMATSGAAVLAVLLARERATPVFAAMAGACCGLAALARAEMLLFVPVAGLAVLAGGPRRVSRALLLLAGAVLVVMPATLHNAREGGFVPIASSGGDNLFAGNRRRATGAVSALDPRAGDLFSMRALSGRLAEEDRGRPLTPAGVSGYWTQRALAEIAADPAGWLALLARKLARVAHPGDPTDVYSLPLERGLYLPTLTPLRLTAWPLLLLAGAGIGLCYREGRLRRVSPLLGLAACQLAALLAFFVSTRLRLPLFYALAGFAGHAAVRGGVALRAGSRPALLGAAVVAATAIGGAALERPQDRDRLRLASVLSTQGRLAEGLAVLAPCTGPRGDALCLDQRGWLLDKQGSFAAAVDAYREAIAAGLPEGRAAPTHSRLANALERLGQVAEAAREHDLAVLDPHGGAGARIERARFRARQGDGSGARSDLEEARRLDAAAQGPPISRR